MASPHPSVSGATMLFYDINGLTKTELREGLDRSGLVDPNDGKSMWALTLMKSARMLNEELAPTSLLNPPAFVKVLEMTVTLPRWIPTKGVPESLQAEWATLSEAMVAHETNHVSIFYDGVSKINAAIVNGPPERWLQRWKIADNKMKTLTIEYDRVTEHGATQGVVWSRD